MDYETVGNVAQIMLDYVEQHSTFQGQRITTVPSDHYLDP